MCGVIEQAITGGKVDDSWEGVHNYASVFIHYASFALGFHNPWGRGMEDAS